MMNVDYHQFINRQLPPIERGCTSKVPYSSRPEARSVARDSRRTDGSLSPYHCPWCGLWHLGHHRQRH